MKIGKVVRHRRVGGGRRGGGVLMSDSILELGTRPVFLCDSLALDSILRGGHREGVKREKKTRK